MIGYYPSVNDKAEDVLRAAASNTPSELTINTFEDAVIFPVGYFGRATLVSQCGVYDKNGLLIADTLMRRGGRVLCSLPDEIDFSAHAVSENIQEALYCGFMTGHFGHMLLESLARIWPIDTLDPDIPLVFVGSNGVNPIVNELIRYYRPTNPPTILVPTEPLKVRKLHVPSPSCAIRNYLHPSHCEPVRRARSSSGSAAYEQQFLYLSRSKLEKNVRRIINEQEIEELITSLGGKVFHPQDHCLEEQLQAVERSKTIVAPLGSASHILLLAKGNRKVVHICGDSINANYILIENALPNESCFVNCLDQTDSLPRRKGQLYFSCDIDILRHALSELEPTSHPHQTQHSLEANSMIFSTPAHSTLDQLGIQFNNDKSSVNRKRPNEPVAKGFGHNYLIKYELFLEKLRPLGKIRFLELGAGPDWNIGASVKVWKEYFKQGLDLHVADIKQTAAALQDNTVTVHIGDLEKSEFIAELSSTGTYHVILDDASHLWSHQIDCLIRLFPSLAQGGVYIVEDIHTSFGLMRERYHGDSKCDAFVFLAHLAALVTGRGRKHPCLESNSMDPELVASAAAMYKDIAMISFINHSCIIVKA